MTRRGWLDEAPLLGENYSMRHVDSTRTTQRGWLDEGDSTRGRLGSLTVSGNGVILDHSPFLGMESSFYRRSKINKYTRRLLKTRRGRLDITLWPYEDYSITQDDSPRMTRWGTITWRELLHETRWLDEDDSTRVTRRGWLDEGTTRRGRLDEDHSTRQDDSTRLLWVITNLLLTTFMANPSFLLL